MRSLPVWCRALGALGVALILRGPLAEAQEPAPEAPRRASPARLPRLLVHRTDDTAGCPDAMALAGLVARHMKRPALDALADVRSSFPSSARGAAPSPGIDVQIYRSEEGYTAVVQTEVPATAKDAARGPRTKTRQLSDKGSSCAGLAAALSITLAILLDTEVPPPPPSDDPPPGLDRSPASSPAELDPSDLARPPDPGQSAAPNGLEDAGLGASSAGRQRAGRSAAAQGRDAVDQGGAPARSLGLTAGLGLAPAEGVLQHGGLAGSGYVELRIGRRLSLAGGVMAFAAQTFPLPFAVPGAEIGKPEATVWITAGLLRGCVTAPVFAPQTSEQSAPATPDQTRAGGCLGLFAGAIHGEASGLPRSSPSTNPWVAGEASAVLEQRLFWRFSLVSRAALLVPLARRVFLVEQGGTAFTTPPVGFTLDTELRLSIW